MRRIYVLVKRQWPAIAVTVVLTVLLGAVLAVLLPPTYRATAVVLVVRERVEMVLEGTGFVEFPNEDPLTATTLAGVAKGPDVLTAARSRSKLNNMSLEEFEDRIELPITTPADQSLRISAVHENKETARRMANAVADELELWVNRRAQQTIDAHIAELERQKGELTTGPGDERIRIEFESKLRQLGFAKKQPPFSAEVLQHAEYDPRPAGPGLGMYLTFSALFGLVAGVSIAHLRDDKQAVQGDGKRTTSSAAA